MGKEPLIAMFLILRIVSWVGRTIYVINLLASFCKANGLY